MDRNKREEKREKGIERTTMQYDISLYFAIFIYIYIGRKEGRIEYALPMNKLIEFYRRWVRGYELVYQRRCPIRRYLVGPHYGR